MARINPEVSSAPSLREIQKSRSSPSPLTGEGRGEGEVQFGTIIDAPHEALGRFVHTPLSARYKKGPLRSRFCFAVSMV